MNQKELKELIDFLIEKDISEFELERGDVKVRIKRGAETAAPVIAHAVPMAAMPMATPPVQPSHCAGNRSVSAARKRFSPAADCCGRRAAHGEISDCWNIL